METHTFFLHLLIILITARVFAEFAVRINVPSVIGELFAGVMLGPSLFGWVEPVESIKLLAEVGILLLLFQVGMETDIRRLVAAGRSAFIVASVGFVLPFVFGYFVCHYLFGLSALVSMFVGGTLTATSIGITVRVLTDLGRQQHTEGQVVLGAAVLDDILGVILLAVLYEFTLAGEVSFTNAGRVMLFVGAFFLLAPLAAKSISLVIKHFDEVSEIPGLLPISILSLVLFFAWLAHVFGAPELLGGFAAGLALSRRFFFPFGTALHSDERFSSKIENQLKPIIYLYTPIFFVYVGLSLSLHKVDWSSPFIWTFSFAVLLVAVFGKIFGAFLLRREPWFRRWIIGIAMIPRGEVGLIFAELGRVSGILDHEVYAALILVIALTTLVPPLVMKWMYSTYGTGKSGEDYS